MKWIHNKQTCLWTKITSTANQNSKTFVKYSIIYIHEYNEFRGVEIYCSENSRALSYKPSEDSRAKKFSRF